MLSKMSVARGDAPFGSVVTKNGRAVSEASNDKNTRINHHAEILALNKAADILGTTDLTGCTLYTNCEPCPMCAFMIREHKISRVVFALASPFMGGFSKWNILTDVELWKFQPFFGPPPTVIGPVLEAKARSVFAKTPLWMFGSDARRVEKRRRK